MAKSLERRGASKWKARSGTAVLSFHSLPLGFFLVSLSPAHRESGNVLVARVVVSVSVDLHLEPSCVHRKRLARVSLGVTCNGNAACPMTPGIPKVDEGPR